MDDIATAILWIFVAVPMIVEACSEAVFWSFVRMAAHGILEPSAFGMWFLLYWGGEDGAVFNVVFYNSCCPCP